MNIDDVLSLFNGVGIDWSRLMAELIVEGTSVLALALAVTWLWRKPSASIRYLVLLSSLISIMMFPVLDATVPKFGFGAAGSSVFDLALPPQIDVFAEVSQGNYTAQSSVGWATLLLYIWFSGVAILLVHSGAGLLRMQRLVRRSEEIRSDGFNRVALRCKQRVAVHRQVKFSQSDEISIPLSWGWRHPVIVLPRSAMRWSRSRREEILLHELAHIRRHDFLSNLLALSTRAFYWFNPLVWVVANRLRFERECAADEYVLSAGASAKDYARSLVEIARSIGPAHRPVLCSTEIVRNSKLKGRIMRILNADNRGVTTSVATKLLVVAVALGATLFVSGISSPAQQESTLNVSAAAQSDKNQDALIVPDTAIRDLDEWPEIVKLEEPTYPKAAKAAGIEGEVWIRVLIDTAGVVRGCEVERGSGFELLDKAALKASCKGQWKPAMLNDKPTPIWVSYKVKFDLEDDEKPPDAEE